MTASFKAFRKKGAAADAYGTSLSVFVSVCFFISGAAGLVYEVIWVRLIDKVIGGAPFAVSTVLSVFMAGLALGSFVAGKAVDRVSARARLLALYGKLEIGIGLFALAAPQLIRLTLPVYRVLYDRLLTHFWCYQVAAIAGCALVLLVPASLMGATLPVLCRYCVLRLDHIGSRTGRLYGLNTVGAAFGIVLCGFVLIKSLGIGMTTGLFAGLNGLVGTTCLILSILPMAEATAPRNPKRSRDAAAVLLPLPETPRRHGRWALVIFAASGFCAMAYEVLWTRLLGLVAGPTTYCFTLVVAAFIIGLALGSIVFGPVADRTRKGMLWLGSTQMGAAAAALVVSQLLGNSQFLFAKLIYVHHDRFSHLMLVQSAALFFILLIPTFLLGAAFPLVTRLCIRSINDMGRNLGSAYALNTLGALAGSFVGGFILIPWVGKENGLRLVILLQFTLAGLALIHSGMGGERKTRTRFALAGVLCCGFFLLTQYPSWHTELLSRGWYRDFDAIETDLDGTSWTQALWEGSERIARQRQGLDVVFQGEGGSGFTTVEKEITSLGTVEYALFNSGKADASSHGDRSTQTLSAHIPLLFHPGAKDVMVLGLASGMTPGEVLHYPVQHLDIVEINTQVVAACKQFFQPWNNGCLEDSRTRLIIQDGRNHLSLTHQCYDVIISEPSNPWMAGLANLYSLEFFQTARARLNAGGIFAQWIQSYEMDWETFCLLGRTFAAVFPEGALVKIGPVDYLMLGFTNGNGFDWSAARSHIDYARASRNAVFPGVDFLAHLILTEDLTGFFGPGSLHTDNRPLLEFAAPMKLFSGTLNMDRLVTGRRRLSPETRKVLAAAGDAETLLGLVEFAASANVPLFNMLPWDRLNASQQARYQGAVRAYCGRVPVPAYNIFNTPVLKTCCAEVQRDAIYKRLAEDDSRAIDHYNLSLALIAAKQPVEAVRCLRKAIDVDPTCEPATLALGLLLAKTGALDEAAEFLSKASALKPKKADPYKYLGMVELRRGALKKAVSTLTNALAISPDDAVVLSELGLAFLRLGDPQSAVAYLTKALERNPKDDESRYYLELAKRKI